MAGPQVQAKSHGDEMSQIQAQETHQRNQRPYSTAALAITKPFVLDQDRVNGSSLLIVSAHVPAECARKCTGVNGWHGAVTR